MRLPALVLAGLACAAPCAALEVGLGPPRAAGGYLWTDVQLSGVFSARVEESLARGMPATLWLHAELWRRRTGWFHSLERSFDLSIRIRYEVWSKSYRIERKGLPPALLSSLDSVQTALAGPLSLPVGRIEPLQTRARHYVVITATLKPLSVEDIEEGEGWLSGEVASKRRAGLGVITALPRSIFDAVRNFAGFGDQKARAISPEFRIDELPSAGGPAEGGG